MGLEDRDLTVAGVEKGEQQGPCKVPEPTQESWVGDARGSRKRAKGKVEIQPGRAAGGDVAM